MLVAVRNRILQINAIKTECVCEKMKREKKKTDELDFRMVLNLCIESMRTFSQGSLYRAEHGACRFRVRKPHLHYNSNGITYIYVCLSTVCSVLSVFQQQSACHKHIIISCLHEMLLWLMIYSFLWIYLNSPSNCAKPCTMCSRMHMNSAVFGNSQNSLDNWLASAGQWLMNWNFNQNDLWAPLRTGQHNLY